MYLNTLRWLMPAALSVVTVTPLCAQELPISTPSVFRRYSEYVVKIEVTENGSGAKAAVGSGFFASANGHVITNYHVISKLVHDPDRYSAGLIDTRGNRSPVNILAVDVIHDLAIVKATVASPRYFTLVDVTPDQGERLYSLGHPSDLGLSIVEGTYNGHLKHAIYPKIHFTGSINPGMSGGPTLTRSGGVVGINVSTAGNALSFLVPVDRAIALLKSTTATGYQPPKSFVKFVAGQLTEYQDVYLKNMFGPDTKTVQLGRFRVPTEPTVFFRCWADATRVKDAPYESIEHSCSTDDYLHIGGTQESGIVSVSHEFITSRSLNIFRFYSLYASKFGMDNTPAGEEEHVTKWKCRTSTVDAGSGPLRSVLCVRAYHKLDGLYDAVLKAVPLGRGNSGVVSTLTVMGATYENITELTSRYVERISWR